MKLLDTKTGLWLWVLMALSATHVQAQFLSWDYTELMPDETRRLQQLRSVVGPDGNLHLTCWNETTNQLLYGMQTASGWQWEQPDPQTEAGYVSDLCFDPQNRLHVVYLARTAAGKAYVKYALRTAAGWTTEAVFPDSLLGPYGPDPDFRTRIVWSVSVQTDAAGQPLLAAFDGETTGFGTCSYATGLAFNSPTGKYDLSMRLMRKNASGQWTGYSPNVLAIKSCLGKGDRFGEFCRILPLNNDSIQVLTGAFHNHQQLLMRFDQDTLQRWNAHVLDEYARNPLAPNFEHNGHFEGYGYLDYALIGDSVLHTIATYSHYYQTGFYSRNKLIYARVRLDSLHLPGYQPYIQDLVSGSSYLRAFEAIEALSADSLRVAFYNTQTGQIQLGSSNNGGNTWSYTTIGSAIVNAQMQLHATADSLLLVYHDADAVGIFLATLPRNGNGAWNIRPIVRATEHGHHLSSIVERSPAADTVYLAWIDAYSQQLWFRAGQNGANEMPDTALVQETQLLRIGADSLAIVYGTVGPAQLRMALRTGSGWQTTILDASANPQWIETERLGDTLHVVYFEANQRVLKHLTYTQGQNPQVAILDSAGQTTGRNLNLLAQGGGLLASYTADDSLRLATWTSAHGWTPETVLNSGNPGNHALALDTLGSPRLAWVSGSDSRLHFSEIMATGWSSSLLPLQSGLHTETVQMFTDSQNRPWIFSNLTTSTDDIVLFRRDAAGIWQQVGITNNPNNIAQTYEAHLVEKDFYLFGRQNLPTNSGIGMLYAREGITAELYDLRSLDEAIVLAPNPSSGDATLSLALPFDGDATVEVLDLTGQVLAHIPVQFAANQILEIPLLRPRMAGYYLCRISCNGSSLVRKWVVLE